MCGFVGFCNLKKNLTSDSYIIKDMNHTLAKRGPDEEGYFKSEHLCFGHRRLIIIDAENGKQPMFATFGDTTYTIVYSGQIYNAKELRKELISFGYEFNRLF